MKRLKYPLSQYRPLFPVSDSKSSKARGVPFDLYEFYTGRITRNPHTLIDLELKLYIRKPGGLYD